jgi:biopolymer transport protein ExbD
MAKGKKRTGVEINASSMADIAFLLLIFFLVTTKIETDQGISVVLPPWSEEPPDEVDVQDRNAFIVLVNSRDQLLVEGEITNIRDLKNKAKRFINNFGRDASMSDSPQAAVISFKGSRGTSYERYIEVYNELRAAYSELRNELSQREYGRPFTELTDSTIVNYVRSYYPIRISEAEPTN